MSSQGIEADAAAVLAHARDVLPVWVGRHAYAVDGLLHRCCARLLGVDDLPPRKLTRVLFHRDLEVDTETASLLMYIDSRVVSGAVAAAPPVVDGRHFPGLVQILGYGSWKWVASSGIWPEEMNWSSDMRGIAGQLDAIEEGRDRLTLCAYTVEGRSGKERMKDVWAAYLADVTAALDDRLAIFAGTDTAAQRAEIPVLHAEIAAIAVDLERRTIAMREAADRKRRRIADPDG